MHISTLGTTPKRATETVDTFKFSNPSQCRGHAVTRNLLLHLFLSSIFYFFNLRDRWSCIRLNEKNMHAKFFLRLLTGGGDIPTCPPLWLRACKSPLVQILSQLFAGVFVRGFCQGVFCLEGFVRGG